MTTSIKCIKKGTTIHFYEMVDKTGKQLQDLDIAIGEDILKSDDEYYNSNGSLFISKESVDGAITEYMDTKYPEVCDYKYEVDGFIDVSGLFDENSNYDEDEIVEIRYGDLRKAIEQAVRMTLDELENRGILR